MILGPKAIALLKFLQGRRETLAVISEAMMGESITPTTADLLEELRAEGFVVLWTGAGRPATWSLAEDAMLRALKIIPADSARDCLLGFEGKNGEPAGSRPNAEDAWKRKVDSRLDAIFEVAEEVLRRYPPRDSTQPAGVTACNAQEPQIDEDEDDDQHTMFCLTGRALDAWWDSLPIQVKAEVMVNHYESLSAFSERYVPTEEGLLALAAAREVQA